MNKKVSLKFVVLATALLVALVLSCAVFAACGAPTYSITWDASNVTVSVSGYDAVPDKAEENSEISFTVSPAEGYKVTSVKNNGTVLKSGAGGAYSFTLTEDAAIVIATEKEAGSLVVTTKPTKLSYYSGESVDRSGMALSLKYKTGDTEAVADVTSSSVTISPAVFSGGEESFKVSYKGVSTTVQLASKVENLVSIDLNGGTLSADAIALFAKQNNYKKNDTTGIITFTYYGNVGTGITLPTAKDMSKKDYAFISWFDDKGESSAHTTLTDSTGSVNLTATWEAELVSVEAVSLENRVVDGKTVSYLIINGTFKAAEQAYLFLFEGNRTIALNGDTVSGTKGQTFELLFDLKNLSDARTESGENYMGAWMDIRFKASLGDRVEEMQIYLDAGNNLDVDLSSKVMNNGFAYSFKTFTYRGQTTLKVCYGELDYSFTVAPSMIDGVPSLTISGTIYREQYFGKIARVSWYQNSENPYDYGTIDANGNWTVVIDLTDFVAGVHTFAHFAVVESEEATETLFGGTSTNLLSDSCMTSFPKLDSVKGNVTNAIRFEDTNGVEYYIGHATWDGLLLYVVAETEA